MKLIDKLFPDRAELAAAQSEVESLSAECDRLRYAIERLESAQTKHYETERKLREQLRETTGKVREQTDADLLLISERLREKIVAGEKPTSAEVAEQQRLIGQRNSLQQQQMALSNTGYGYSTLGALGLAGIFGGSQH